MSLTIGQRVRVLRECRKEYRQYTFTVRALRECEVCVDDGDPENPDWRDNGARVLLWAKLSSVEPVAPEEVREHPGVRKALLHRLDREELVKLRRLCLDAANYLDDLGTASGDTMAARLRAAGGDM